MSSDYILGLSILLSIISIIIYIIKNEEIILIIPLFYILTGVQRYFVVLSGKAKWVIVAYSRSIFYLNNSLALEALNLFLFGTLIFLISFILSLKNKKNIITKIKDNDIIFRKFLNKKKNIINYIIYFIFINK